jgi:16S rRNA (guanine(966)-N(2))-methyltransferase RsmD
VISDDLRGARFLDLFAGSGAVGLEALSRGALAVDFVENGPTALHSLKANVAALREGRRTRIFKKDAVQWVRSLQAGQYDVAYIDAPYGSRKLDLVIEYWQEIPFARILVVEHAKEHGLALTGRRFDCEGPTRLTIVST